MVFIGIDPGVAGWKAMVAPIISNVTIRTFVMQHHTVKLIIFKKRANPGLFLVYFRSFQTNITNFYNKYLRKMSIQYTVFEPTTFGT